MTATETAGIALARAVQAALFDDEESERVCIDSNQGPTLDTLAREVLDEAAREHGPVAVG